MMKVNLPITFVCLTLQTAKRSYENLFLTNWNYRNEALWCNLWTADLKVNLTQESTNSTFCKGLLSQRMMIILNLPKECWKVGFCWHKCPFLSWRSFSGFPSNPETVSQLLTTKEMGKQKTKNMLLHAMQALFFKMCFVTFVTLCSLPAWLCFLILTMTKSEEANSRK